MQTDSESEDYAEWDSGGQHKALKTRHRDLIREIERNEAFTEFADPEADRVRALERKKKEELRKAMVDGKVTVRAPKNPSASRSTDNQPRPPRGKGRRAAV